MSELSKKSCRACSGKLPIIAGSEARSLLSQLPGWQLSDAGHLVKRYTYSDFSSALDAANRIGALAEAQGHHPDLHLSWGKLGVELWTHKVSGLTESDFILAAKIEDLLSTE